MPRYSYMSVIFALLLTFTSMHATAQEMKPGRIVQDTVDQVLTLLTDTSLSEQDRKDRIYGIVGEQINFSGMSRRILAINWKKANEQQKQAFEDLFRLILLNTYWDRISGYNNEKVEFITGMIEGNRFATVDTVIISEKIEIPITYRMELVDGKWLAYDFLIESLSLVTSYRTEYRNIVKTRGMDGLLEHMQEKLDSAES